MPKEGNGRAGQEPRYAWDKGEQTTEYVACGCLLIPDGVNDTRFGLFRRPGVGELQDDETAACFGIHVGCEDNGRSHIKRQG